MKYLKTNRDTVDLVVIHTAECPRLPGKARAVARFLEEQAKSSAHYIVDSSEVIACVPEECVAWHAPGANQRGIGVELVGYAKDGWSDSEALDTLERAVDLVTSICRRWEIPPIWLSEDDLRAMRRGITGHLEVTDAYNNHRGHVDPGVRFPRGWFAERVAEALGMTGGK